MNLMQSIVLFHVGAGTVALATYWTAGLMKKGSPRHRLVGRAYLLAMLAILLSGIPLVARALLDDKPNAAAFLGFLLLLVAQGCWSAWRAIRDRRSPQRYFGPVFWTLTGATVLAGAAMIVLGVRIGQPIFAVFGGVGALVGFGAMQARRRADTDPVWWLREHYGAMIGNGVATHIAFFGIGLRRLLPGVDPGMLQMFAWFGPLVAAGVAGWWIGRKYGRKPVRQAARTTNGAGAVSRSA
jgi:uncharacterized membrane protein